MEHPKVISRKEARAQGLTYYFTGRPCKHGHITFRYVSNKQCVECYKLAQRKYREANRGRLTQRMREYRRRKSDYFREYARAYYRRNAERIRAADRERYRRNPMPKIQSARMFRKKNPDYCRIYHYRNREIRVLYSREYYRLNAERLRERRRERDRADRRARNARKHRRRARLKGNGGSYTMIDVRRMYQEQQGLCVYCRTPLGDDFHIDHIMPLALGGSNNPDNLQLLCPSCNHRKSWRHPEEFEREIGFVRKERSR